jgi:hypothetical protein
MTTYKHEISAADLEHVNALLSFGKRSDLGRKGEVIWQTTVPVGEGREVDIKVVNGLGADDAPYVDIVLFDEGCEIGCLDVQDAVIGTFAFPGEDIVIDVCASESPSPRI